jgi:small-conductance mechanosensitive channel
MEEFAKGLYNKVAELIKSIIPGLEGNETYLGLIGSLIATLIAVVFIVLIIRSFRSIEKRISSFMKTKMRGVKIQSLEVISQTQAERYITKSIKWISYIPIFIVFYLYINLVFSFFPYTRGLGSELFSHFVNAVTYVFRGLIGYVPQLITLLVIVFVAHYFVKLTRTIFNGLASERLKLKGFDPEWAEPTFDMVRIFIIVLAIMVAYPYLPGASSPAFTAVSAFLGVLLALGSTGSIANMISGISLIYMKLYRIGDVVTIADIRGVVVERSTLVTRLKTPKNVEISIPNSMIISNHIINYTALSKESGLILHTSVTIGYDVPWRKVEELLIKAAQETEAIEKSPEPFVLQRSLDDYYVTYELNAYTRSALGMLKVYNELHRNIQDIFFEAGVEIASPHLSNLRDGNSVNIPEEYLPKDYEPQSFRVQRVETGTGKPDDEN